MMTRTLLIVAPMLLAAAGAVGDTITLRGSVRLTGSETVRLQDIAVLEGEYAKSLAAVEITVLDGDTTSPLEVRVSEIRRTLDEHGVHWGRIELHGHRAIVRSRSGAGIEPPLAMRPIDLSEVGETAGPQRRAMDRVVADTIVDTQTFRGWLARSIMNTLGVEAADLRLDFPRSHAELLDTPLSSERFEIRPLNVAEHSERLDFEVRRWRGGRPAGRELVSVEPLIQTKVARLRIDVQRGRPVLPEHVEHVEQWMTPMQRTGRIDPDALDGQAAGVRLRAGTILRNRDLKKAVLVKRGDEIRVSCLVGGAVLTLRATAESGGSAGETIMLRKGRDRETFSARITARGEAVLDLAGPATVTVADATGGDNR